MATLQWGQDGGVYRRPTTRAELAWQLKMLFGLEFPDKAVCPGHISPFEAVAEAYFAEHPVTIWKASRGFSGKTTAMAALSLMELIGGFDVVLLGGSGEQSARAHRVSRMAWNHRKLAPICPRCQRLNYWDALNCIECMEDLTKADQVVVQSPEYLLRDEPLITKTSTRAGNEMQAITASTKAARGPHPQRLRMDEADEMDLKIIDAAMGQTMTTDLQRPAQTTFASTHHYETGTMTELLRRAAMFGWPVREWCYRETLVDPKSPGTWLLPENIEQKKQEVTSRMWRVEYDLELPQEGGSVFSSEVYNKLFVGKRDVSDTLNTYIELEQPVEIGEYVTSADWGRKTDLSVIATVRYDANVAPRLVAWARFFRQPWQKVIDHFNERVDRYPGRAIHDATGIGDVVDAYLTGQKKATPFIITGASRAKLFLDYEKSVEDGSIQLPRFESLMGIHRSVQREDLYGSEHPPDELVALALACQVAIPKKPKTRVVRGIRTF
jgi:hypothetical protein